MRFSLRYDYVAALFSASQKVNCCTVFDHIRHGMQSDMMDTAQLEIVA